MQTIPAPHLEPCPHPDCFLVLGICRLLLLLGSVVALAATPAACAVLKGAADAVHGLATASAGNRGPGSIQSNGLRAYGTLHAWALPAHHMAPSSTAQTAWHAACMRAANTPDGYKQH